MIKQGRSFFVLLMTGLLCVCAIVSTTTHASFTQDKTQVERDLLKFFTKSNLVSFDSARTETSVRETSKLSFNARGKTWEINLTANDLRASNYRAEKTVDGALVAVEMNGVHTYKGSVAGLSNATARFTIDDTTIQGVIFGQDENFYLEPARRYSNKASETDYVFYSERDLIKKDVGSCPVGLNDAVNEAVKEYMPQTGQQRTESVSGMKYVDLATDADNEYVAAFGGSAQANNAILSILNVVQGVYERDLNLRLRVSYQHTWETADPYAGTDPTTMLVQFRDYWNANFTGVSRDLAHMWTGRTMNSGYVGYSYIGVACNSPANSYGISMKFDYEPNKFYITAHELGHNFGAQHVDGQSGCFHTIMESAIHYEANSFCQVSRDQIGAHAEANSNCLSNATKACFDFDADGKTDISIFRPSLGQWWYQQSGDLSVKTYTFGTATDKIVPADYDGDGKTDVAVWRPATGEWLVLRSSNLTFFAAPFGASADLPAPGDFDADGKADFTVFRPTAGAWFINKTTGGVQINSFGTIGDVPVVADYDGDAKADLAIYRPAGGSGNSEWWLLRSSAGVFATQFGTVLDKPVQADYTGDGKADIAFFRPATSEWYVLRSEDVTFYAAPFGGAGDTASPGDYDGDGKSDFAVFRPSSATWYVLKSGGGVLIQAFGSTGDRPVPNAFVP